MKILPNSRAAKFSIFIIAPLAAAYGFYSLSQTSAPDIAEIQFAADPLYSQGAGQKPTLTLALSVEYPTVGAQFRDDYKEAEEYPGYFDVNSCYSYKDDSNENNRRFERSGLADSHKCNGAGFSGNFMNWATSSSIDLLRYGLTGGDRFKDEAGLTVLQRAVLKTSFWNDDPTFLQKNISKNIAAQALPSGILKNIPGNVYISNCLNRVFFSTKAANGNCEAPDFTQSLGAKKSSGSNQGPFSNSEILSTDMFFTRVKVCDASGSKLTDPRITLCQRYPNGNFKPVGNMQKYSDRIRLSAFGYLLEDGNNRYGGVLRAPMTYVGPKAYDENGNSINGDNPYQEWSADSGIFIDDPRNAKNTSKNIASSGVINYLNKFGRSGNYKSNDPVGELYYESIRYLQGLQPTPNAVSSISNAFRDGFPAYENWDDPFAGGSRDKNYACLRNSILLIGDVNTHNDKSLPGNNRTSNSDFNRVSEVNLSNNIPNFKEWTKVIGAFESGGSVNYIDGDGVTRTTSNPTSTKDSTLGGLEDKDTGASGAAYYIAGAAYWAHTHDIRGTQWSDTAKQRPGMRVTTYVLDVNENSAQSKNATNRHRSQFFLTAKYGGFTDASGTGNPFLPANVQNQYDNRHWEKENESGEAKTYFLSSDAKSVLKALDDIFIAATKVSNTISSPAPSTTSLTTEDGYVYLASFDPEYWSGDLKRNTLKLNSAGSIEQGNANSAVSAAAKLDALTDSGTDARKIYIGKTTNAASSYATSFTWSAIESGLKENLNKETATATVDGNGENRLKFIRGNRSLEGSTFRKRGSRMGDIINAGATYSAAPTTRYNSTTYKTFFAANKNRTKAVFIGANDGMLHAFNADTMAELFSYIPSSMGSKLSLLTAADYNSSRHTSYVDATPVVAEAEVSDNWKTVLVSGTGGGSQGVFALDVTDPAAFNENKVMWEFTDADDPDMGNVVGQPKILKIRTSAPKATKTTYQWFAVVPSGVNNYVNDGTGRFSTTGKPALFLLSLSKPTSDAWSLGSNYFKISLPTSNDLGLGTQMLNAAGNGTGQGKATGLINFEATGDSQDAVKFIYMGDLHGQFWKLDMEEADFSQTTSDSWDLNALSAFKNPSSSAVPMFIAKTAQGKVQPITMVPTIAYGPNGSLIAAFGTGKYLEAPDNAITASTQVQSFYVLYDNNETKLATGNLARYKGRENLQQGSISSANITVGQFYWTDPKDTSATTSTKKSGWFIDFPYSGVNGGERQTTNAVVYGKNIRFNSLMPPSASQNVCGGGSSYTYTANLASGLGNISAVSAGALGAPMVFKLDSSVTTSGSTGLRNKKEKIAFGNPSSTGDNKLNFSDTESVESLVGRLSWRQINNYQELKNKSW